MKISNNILLQAGGLDAFIYTSYIQNYSDLVKRLGITYYSLRVAHIYPSGFISWLLGAEPGYVVYRFLLLCTVLGVAWSFSRKLYSVSVAFFVTMLAACHPWLLRSLFWEHYDSSGVTYLLLATSLLGGAATTDRWRLFLAGAAYALAAICNTFLLGIGFALFASYFFVNLRFRLKDWVRPGVLSICGFLTIYVSLCVIRFAQVPSRGFVFDLFLMRFAATMITGMGERWHANVIPLISRGWAHLLVPAIVLVAIGTLLITRHGKQRLVVFHAGLNLLLVVVIYIFVDFVQKAAVISLFYYFIYLFPATLFCLIVLIGEAAEAVDVNSRRAILGGCGVLCLVGYLVFAKWPLLLAGVDFRWSATLAVLAMGGAAIPMRHAKASMVALTLAALACPIPFYKMPAGTYTAIHTANAGLEWDVYRAALKLQRLVIQNVPARVAPGFWYTNQNASRMNSVQSMYLWGPTRLAPSDDPSGGMPALTAAMLAKVPRFRYMILLAEQPEEIAAGKIALDSVGITTRVVAQESYDGRYFSVKYCMLERLDSAFPRGRP